MNTPKPHKHQVLLTFKQQRLWTFNNASLVMKTNNLNSKRWYNISFLGVK